VKYKVVFDWKRNLRYFVLALIVSQVDRKNLLRYLVRKPTFDVIVSVCAPKSFVFGNRIPKSN